MSEIELLQNRLRDVIKTRCHSVGCKGCDLKWDDGCSATELDGQIMDLEMDKHLPDAMIEAGKQ